MREPIDEEITDPTDDEREVMAALRAFAAQSAAESVGATVDQPAAGSPRWDNPIGLDDQGNAFPVDDEKGQR